MKKLLTVLFTTCVAGSAFAEESGGRPSVFDPGSFEIRPEGHVRIYLDPSVKDPTLDRAFNTSITLSIFETLHFAAGELIWGAKPKEQTPLERIVRSAGSALPLVLLEIPITGASHEYGHFRGYSVAGMNDPVFLDSLDNRTEYYIDPGVAFREIALQSFVPGEFLYASQDRATYTAWLKNPKYMPYRAQYEALIDEDGLNQEQYNAESVAKKVLRGHAHPLDAIPYFIESGAPVYYDIGSGGGGPGGDIDDYCMWLKTYGVNTSPSQIRYTSQIPKLFSNSTISLLWAWLDYWISGDDAVEPLALKIRSFRINWPDFYSYLTLHGPTIKGVERVSWRNYAVNLSYERSLSDGSSEAGIMLEGDVFRWLSVSVEGLRNFKTGGTWAEVEIALHPLALFGKAEPLRWFEVGARGYYGKGDTFRREIIGSTLHFTDETTHGLKWFLGASIPF